MRLRTHDAPIVVDLRIRTADTRRQFASEAELRAWEAGQLKRYNEKKRDLWANAPVRG